MVISDSVQSADGVVQRILYHTYPIGVSIPMLNSLNELHSRRVRNGNG